MRELPHYLRFARALALVGGASAFAWSAGCGDDSTDPTGDAADTTVSPDVADTLTTSPDTSDGTTVADADAVEDTVVNCATCECASEDISESCVQQCCINIGPLAPPDLPSAADATA